MRMKPCAEIGMPSDSRDHSTDAAAQERIGWDIEKLTACL
jgi:hypothetical protein